MNHVSCSDGPLCRDSVVPVGSIEPFFYELALSFNMNLYWINLVLKERMESRKVGSWRNPEPIMV